MIGAALKFVSEKVSIDLIDSLSQAVTDRQDARFIVSLSKA